MIRLVVIGVLAAVAVLYIVSVHRYRGRLTRRELLAGKAVPVLLGGEITVIAVNHLTGRAPSPTTLIFLAPALFVAGLLFVLKDPDQPKDPHQ